MINHGFIDLFPWTSQILSVMFIASLKLVKKAIFIRSLMLVKKNRSKQLMDILQFFRMLVALSENSRVVLLSRAILGNFYTSMHTLAEKPKANYKNDTIYVL